MPFGIIRTVLTKRSLAVRFGLNNETKVSNILRKTNIAGKITLVNAIVEATGDFNDPDRFVGEGVHNSIIVITDGGDFCYTNPAKVIQNRLRGRIEVSFRLIGMGLTRLWRMRSPDNCSSAEDITQLTSPVIDSNGNFVYTINGSMETSGDYNWFRFSSWELGGLAFLTTGNTNN